MKFIQGHNRTQINLFPVSPDQSIDPENEVRMLEEYTRALAENDGDNRQLISDEIAKQQKRKDEYKEIEKELIESGEPQVSTSDPESRQIMVRNNITEVAYCVQTTVDAKNNIPIDYKVTNQNDSKAMGNMVRRAKSILRLRKTCPAHSNCTRSKDGRVLSRSTFAEYYERNRINYEA